MVSSQIENIVKFLFAVIIICLLAYIMYKLQMLDIILDLEKRQSIQMAGQSVALGSMAACIGCGREVAERLSSLVLDS